MTAELNEGKGLCSASARLLIKPVRAVLELGALPDVLAATLNCVHHANRTGDAGDFIAIALPGMHMGREIMRAGHEIELIGSEASLSRLEAFEGLQILRRRGMIEALEIGETWAMAGETGAAYVRDRSGEKYTPGWVRRSAARAERRGKPLGRQHHRAHGPDETVLALFYGSAVVHVREVIAPQTEAPLQVTTYGFSSPAAPAILPVLPDSARVLLDAG
ncbi:hypothetical protein [Frigidibacter sp. MR17.24]|uniref:hypothetical protein n=1 Tax=Frigidibacter sp. MR17.24 TaxID=3127345 RepID=UPI0030130044